MFLKYQSVRWKLLILIMILKYDCETCFVFFKRRNMKCNSFNVINYLNDLRSVLDRNKCFVVSLIYLWASFSALVDKHHSLLFCTFPFILSHHLLQQIRLIRDLMVLLNFLLGMECLCLIIELSKDLYVFI